MIARQQELARLFLIPGKSKHAIKPIDRIQAPGFERAAYHFRFGMGTRALTAGFQLCPDSFLVVDFSIQHKH